jgi:hypothetical protein
MIRAIHTIEEFGETMSKLNNDIKRGKSINSQVIRGYIMYLVDFYETAAYDELLNGGLYARTNKLYRENK